jgi:hypothetical protein
LKREGNAAEVGIIFKIIIFFCPEYSWRISKDSLRHLVLGAPTLLGKEPWWHPWRAGYSVRCWLALPFVSVVAVT